MRWWSPFTCRSRSPLPRRLTNRAFDVPCYEPGYTLVEKLQTISTKFRRHLEDGSMPQNFLRHYYDVYCRSEEHTSELQSLMRISYAVFCLQKNKKQNTDNQ